MIQTWDPNLLFPRTGSNGHLGSAQPVIRESASLGDTEAREAVIPLAQDSSCGSLGSLEVARKGEEALCLLWEGAGGGGREISRRKHRSQLPDCPMVLTTLWSMG